MWTFCSGEGDFAIVADDIDSVGPSLIGAFGGVIHVIHEDRDFEFEVFGAVFGGFFAIGEGFVVGDEDTFADVGLGLFAVGGMGFADVDNEEFGFGFCITEPTVQFFGVLPEWGSGV